MKTPDKLYIGRRNYGPLIGGWESQPFTSKEIESIEYIRKDALMDWLENYIEILRKENKTVHHDAMISICSLIMSKLDVI